MELCVEAHDEQFFNVKQFYFYSLYQKKSLGNNHTKFCVSLDIFTFSKIYKIIGLYKKFFYSFIINKSNLIF